MAIFVFVISWSIAAEHKLAEQRNIIFDRLGTEDGLSQGIVTAFAQDRRGFMWIGTQEGLNRFDGFQFQSFYHIADDRDSLSHDSIWALFFDSSDRFWVGTDAGLNLFDEISQSFKLVQLDAAAISQPEVYAIIEDPNKNIWVGTSVGLFRLEAHGLVPIKINGDSRLPQGGIRSLAVSLGSLLIGSELNGLYSLDLETERVSRLLLDSEGSPIVDDLHIHDLVVDRNNNVWIGTFNGGLTRLELSTGRAVKFSPGSLAIGSLASNRVRSILEDERGEIWIGTDSGLHLWLAESESFTTYEVDLTDPRSISDNSVVDIFQDEGGVIWVGTFSGINKWNARTELFPYFKRSADSNEKVSGDNVTSFADDGNNDVWIGTLSGLMHWDSETAVAENYSAERVGLSDRRVMALHKSQGKLWVGTMAGGVNLIDGDRVTAVYRNEPRPDSISSNAITKIYEDSAGQIWVATYGGGVNLHLGDGSFKRFPILNLPDGQFSDLRCLDIMEDPDGNIWIATDGGGVVILDPTTGRTELLSHNVGLENSIASNNNLSLLLTSKGMWIGSVDGGLSFYDFAGNILRFTKKDGLASDSVYGLLEDDSGKIWISGGKGLSVFNPSTLSFGKFDSSHGLQSSDFNSGAYARLLDGSFVFGGNNGFNAFYPQRIKLNEYIPPVHITTFKLFNEKVGFGKSLNELDQIDLDHDDSVIGFEFAALDYTAPRKNKYRYMLEGFDRGWVDHDGDREATYTNLDAGAYVFRVQGSNNDGVWNEDGASLPLIVHPAPWFTWWAYCVYAVLAAAGLFMLLKLNSDRMQRVAERRYSERLQLYIESLEEASDCILIADSDAVLLYANNTITQVLNKTPKEVVGETLWDVLFEEAGDVEAAREALDSEGRYHGEVQLVGAGGASFTHDVTIAAVQQSSSNELAYVGISRDVTERKVTEAELEDYRKNLESIVGERTEALQKEIAENKAIQVDLADSLQEKELLIKEVHHRVKNNMQVISSLLSIQAEGAGDERYSTLLNESQQRIKSMALIHETLYQSKDLLNIDFQEYIDSLTTSLSRSYSVPGVSVHVDVKVQNVLLDLETAVPCGLVINELVSNSLKHAFVGKEGVGIIDIDFAINDCNYELRIADNGIGLPPEFDVNRNTSMGLEIVSILTAQLEGTLSARNEDGAVFEIKFPRSAHV